jgi:PTH1 family peptidyl-tRNA hydrolase
MGAVGQDDFTRLRIGIGRPEFQKDVSDYVLRPFSGTHQASLDKILRAAQEAVLTILCKGAKEGMNRFNNKQILNESE